MASAPPPSPPRTSITQSLQLEPVVNAHETPDAETPVTGPALSKLLGVPGNLAEVLSTMNARLQSVEDHNEEIQAQLEKTQQMIATLTDVIAKQSTSKAMACDASGHGISALQSAASLAPPDRRQRSAEALDSMTRTIDMRDAIMQLPHANPMSLASAVGVMARIAKAASTRTLRPPDRLAPMLTRRFSMSTLDYNKKGSRLERFAQWSMTAFGKARVDPGVTRRELQEARTEDCRTHPYTINHESSGRVVWDLVVLGMTLVDIVVTPLSLSFDYNPSGLVVFNILATMIFTFDFVVQAMSSYTTERGRVVSGPAYTIPHYLLSPWAAGDFLSWFPFEYLVPSTGRFLGVAKVIRLVKISQLARRLHSSKKAGFFRLLRLFGIVFLVSHCLACYWNWVAKVWRVNEEGYLDKALGSKYSHCWSLVIGSLNASPPAMYTPIEEISVSVFMLIGNVLQASVFGSVAVLISSFDEEEVAYNKKLINTYERCKLLDIPEKLADRIRNFYEHLYLETRSVDPDADSFINELSPALICEVKFQLYRDMVKQIPFFSSTNISPVVIEMLILRLRTVIYMQDDVLIRKGEFGDWMGFIGSKGSVGVLDPNSDMRKIIRILRKGDYFGEMGLLHRTKRTTTTVALSWVQIHVLSRQDLDEVKEQYAEEAESLEDEIKIYMKSRFT